MKRFGLAFVLGALGVLVTACGDTTPTSATQLNLDRPIDMTFACYGGMRVTNGSAADPTMDPSDLTVSAQPLEACDIRTGFADANGNAPVPPGQEDLTASGGSTPSKVAYFGFILQSAQGTVALATWDAKTSTAFVGADVSVLDSDPLTLGNNPITVGEDPIAIVTDQVGCYVVTANAGSCDMSALDIGTALDLGETPGVRVDRLDIKNAAGQPVRARPAAMVAQPPGGTIGVACPATPTGLAYVAYPGCHLVAGVDLSTGTIKQAIQYDASGVPTLLDAATVANVSCPAECDGAVATAGIRPVTVDLQRDAITGRHLLAIGADNSPALAFVELDANDIPQAQPFQIALENTTGTLGVTQVTISPQIGMGGSAGIINDDISPYHFQFAYAVANDRTVRVADILNVRKECDAQVDPRFLFTKKQADVPQLSCLAVGDPTTPPRRAGARGPGIELVGDDVPTSVATYRVDTFPGDTRDPKLDPTVMIGYFGAISSASGQVYVFNIDDDSYADFVDPTAPLSSQIPLAIAHQLRDGVPNRGTLALSTDSMMVPVCDNAGPDPDATTGELDGPRSPAIPAQNIPSGYYASDKIDELPSIRQVLCQGQAGDAPVSELMFSAPQDVRVAEFPDLRGLRSDESWTLTWEGALSADTGELKVDGPVVREGQLAIDAAGMRLDDQTRPFCDAGVEQYDIVQLRGCDPTNGNNDCPVGYVCYVHPESPVTNLGACELSSEADRLADACKGFLTSLRTYTVSKSNSGELVLLPRKHELRTTPIDGCTDTNQCQNLANFAVQNPSASNPVDMTTTDTRTWSCEIDSLRKPELDALGAPMKRCVETCPSGMDADCTSGAVCQNGYCMEGVEPPQACVNAPQRYELHSSESFAVIGTKSGYVHPLIADATGSCTRDPKANPLEIGRIPLHAAACDPTADPLTGVKPDGTLDVNPCETTVAQTELDPNYIPGTCNLAAAQTVLVTRQATAIRFRNRGLTLTLVDPTYPGDAMCIGDRMGGLGNIPVVAPNYQIAFRQAAGFAPLVLATSGASLPIKVIRQPLTPSSTNTSEAFWVVDEGDFISQTIDAPSTRGRVYRIESDSLGTVNILQ